MDLQIEEELYKQIVIESLDLMNILEVKKIRELIEKDKKLVEMFDEMIAICNKKVNKDAD